MESLELNPTWENEYLAKKTELYKRISCCGKDSILMQRLTEENIHSGYFLKTYRCQEESCFHCAPKIQEMRLIKLNHSVNQHNMRSFLTLTTSEDYQALTKKYENVFKKIKMLNLNAFNKKYKCEGDEKFKAYAEKLAEDEVMLYYLFNEMHPNGKGKYLSTYTLELHNLLLKEGIEGVVDFFLLYKSYFSSESVAKRYRAKLKEKNISPYLEIKKISGNTPRLISLRRKLFQDFEEYFYFRMREDMKRIDVSVVERFKQEFKESILASCQKELAYVRVLEWTKQDRPHFHILLNYPVPRRFLEEASSEDSYVSDIQYLEENDFETSQKVSEYVVKYVTKDTADHLLMKSVQDNFNYRRIVSSQNVDISPNIEDEKGDKMVEITRIKGKIHKTKDFVEVTSNPDVWIKRNLVDANQNYNPIFIKIEELHESFEQKLKEIKKRDDSSHFEEEMSTRELKRQITKRKKEEIKKLTQEFQTSLDILSTEYLKSELDKRKYCKPLTKLKPNGWVLKEVYQDDKTKAHAIMSACSNDKLFTIVQGFAGTGKSTMMKKFIESTQSEIVAQGLTVVFCSLTGKASSVLRAKLPKGYRCETIHSLCRTKACLEYPKFIHHYNNLLKADIVVIDEFSMVSTLLFACLLNALDKRTKIILLGDAMQLNPIKSNLLISNLEFFDNKEVFTLTKVFRSTDNVLALANPLREGKYDHLSYVEYDLDFIQTKIREGYQVLTNTKKLAKTINKSFNEFGEIGCCVEFNYSINQKVLFLRNDKQNDIFNGEFATLLKYQDNRLFFKNERGKDFSYPVMKSLFFEPSFAMTIHKSQGSEFEKVLVVVENSKALVNANLLYTALTRAKYEVIVMLKNFKTDDLRMIGQKQSSHTDINLGNVESFRKNFKYSFLDELPF